jgi:hypothetical protein
VLLACTPTLALADDVTTVLSGSHVDSVTAGGDTWQWSELRAYASSGAVSFTGGDGYGVTAADDRNLETYFARDGATGAVWEVELDGWLDPNGARHDFFLFEAGGGDSLDVAPRFLDGSYGQPIALTGWTDTGHVVETGPNAGQPIHGLAFKRSQLLRPNGNTVPPGMVIDALRFVSSQVDVAAFLAVDPAPVNPADGDGGVSVAGPMRAGQPLELHFSGPWASETDEVPNPFLDYRLDVTFVGPQQTLVVPGFFDADGAGGEAGTVWKVRFTPPTSGTWTATASFREGPDVAVELAPNAGTPGMLDGAGAAINVLGHDTLAPGFWRFGTLRYVGEHYQRFDAGPYFIKTGTNSPENLLAYRGFDGVGKLSTGSGALHSYAPHVGDWNPGDPLFEGSDHEVDSKGIIGALNYLSEQGVNSIFAILMNLGGDGQDVHPFLGPSGSDFDNTHYDTSRLAQWNTVFEHAARKGVALNLVLNETEAANENWLDGGVLGPQRKLFYRELVARFAHNPAIKWTLVEENTWSANRLRGFADYIGAQDPYDHPVTFHNLPEDFAVYSQILGEERFSATALQFDPDLAGMEVEQWRANSAGAGRPWLLHMDENTPWWEGVSASNQDDLRKRALYDVLFSGGQIEWYFGFHDLPLGSDLDAEDFRQREPIWEYSAHARRLLELHMPFWRMEPMDWLLSGESGAYGGGEVFAAHGEAYALYFPSASSTGTLDLSGTTGLFRLRWYDPRTGEFVGTSTAVPGGGPVALPAPPHSSSEDWVAIVHLPRSLDADTFEISIASGGAQTLMLDAGAARSGRAYQVIGSLSGTSLGLPIGTVEVPLNFDMFTRFTLQRANTSFLQDTRGVLDQNGEATASFDVPPGTFGALAGSTVHFAYFLSGPIDFASNPIGLLLRP